MRQIYFLLGVAAAVFIVPQSPAMAHPGLELQRAACDYADATDLFHRSLCRCRRATDYTERLADRLASAAAELREVARRWEDPRRVAIVFDEVYVLHHRLAELVGRGCQRPDPLILSYWDPVECAWERLWRALNGCHEVCPLSSYGRQTTRRPVLPRPHVAMLPPVVAPVPSFMGPNPSFGFSIHWGDRNERNRISNWAQAPFDNLDRRDHDDWDRRDGRGRDGRDRDGRDRDRDGRDVRGPGFPFSR